MGLVWNRDAVEGSKLFLQRGGVHSPRVRVAKRCSYRIDEIAHDGLWIFHPSHYELIGFLAVFVFHQRTLSFQ